MRLQSSRSWSVLTLLCLVASPGCDAARVTAPTYEYGGADGGGVVTGTPADDAVPPTRAIFDAEVQPILQAQCASCHADPAIAPGFMQGPDVYARVMEFPGLVDPGNAAGSSLLSKGAHAGPAFGAADALVVRSWIQAEGVAAEGPADVVAPGPRPGGPVGGGTEQQQVRNGVNEIDLGSLGLTGARLSFTAASVATGLLLSDVTLLVGDVGVRVERPTLYCYVGGALAETQTLEGVVLTVPANRSAVVTNSILLPDMPIGAYLSVDFATATSTSPSSEPPSSGSNELPVASFAVEPLAEPFAVRIDGSGSTDPDGDVVAYSWDLGDGTTAYGVRVDHTYGAAGAYDVRLIVTDNAGGTGVRSQEVLIEEPPVLDLAGFFLVDADTDTDIRPLLDGDALVLADLPPNLSVRVEPVAVVGSVRFDVDGVVGVSVHNVAPYAVADDTGGDFEPYALLPGAHTITATGFSATETGGLEGPPLTITVVVE